jgi:hypothetical protein
VPCLASLNLGRGIEARIRLAETPKFPDQPLEFRFFADAQQTMTYSAAAAFIPFILAIPANSLLRRGTSMAALPMPLIIVCANKKVEQGWRG